MFIGGKQILIQNNMTNSDSIVRNKYVLMLDVSEGEEKWFLVFVYLVFQSSMLEQI